MFVNEEKLENCRTFPGVTNDSKNTTRTHPGDHNRSRRTADLSESTEPMLEVERGEKGNGLLFCKSTMRTNKVQSKCRLFTIYLHCCAKRTRSLEKHIMESFF